MKSMSSDGVRTVGEDVDAELFEERAAIREFDGGQPREEAEREAAIEAEAHRHRCEVRWTVGRFYPDPDRLKAHLAMIALKRGQAASDRLRDDCRYEWRKYRDDLAGTA